MHAGGDNGKNRSHSRWILWYSALEEREVFAVLIVKPFHFEVQIHVISTLTEAVLFMLWRQER